MFCFCLPPFLSLLFLLVRNSLLSLHFKEWLFGPKEDRGRKFTSQRHRLSAGQFCVQCPNFLKHFERTKWGLGVDKTKKKGGVLQWFATYKTVVSNSLKNWDVAFVLGTIYVFNFFTGFAISLSVKLFWNFKKFWRLLHTYQNRYPILFVWFGSPSFYVGFLNDLSIPQNGHCNSSESWQQSGRSLATNGV